jgi:four helix bundle protein
LNTADKLIAKGEESMVIQKCKDLQIYNESFELAMNIFEVTKVFPKEEKYSLIDQLRRSSRSIPANIREGFAKRKYPDIFTRHLNDALGSSEETLTWVEFSYKCQYISKDQFETLSSEYKKIGAMIFKLMQNWQKFQN